LDETSKKLQEHLKDTATRLTEEFNEEKIIILNDLNDDIEQLKRQEKAEIDTVLKEYDSLMKLKHEYAEIEQDYKTEVEKLEIEDEKIDANLFDFTIRELKEIADNKGLEYPQRILKADLVNLIEDNNNDDIIFEE